MLAMRDKGICFAPLLFGGGTPRRGSCSGRFTGFGDQLAAAISGGDIKTITRYYADPAQPNLGDIRVSELL